MQGLWGSKNGGGNLVSEGSKVWGEAMQGFSVHNKELGIYSKYFGKSEMDTEQGHGTI